MRLDGVSAVVTGAAGGIGTPLCRQLVSAGARVLLVGRSAERLGSLARALGDLPHPRAATADRNALRDRIDVLAVDLTTPAGRHAVVATAAARQVNLLVHAAAIASFGPIESLDDRHLDELIRTDLVAPIALTRAMLPVLRSVPQAAILTIGSAVGSIGLPGFTAYGAAKAGIHAFSEALRRELAGGPVRVQYLGARATRTGFNDARVDAYNTLTRTRSDAPETVAAAAVAMIESGRSERHLGFPERFFVRLNALVPTWLDGGFVRHRHALERAMEPAIAVQRPAAGPPPSNVLAAKEPR